MCDGFRGSGFGIVLDWCLDGRWGAVVILICSKVPVTIMSSKLFVGYLVDGCLRCWMWMFMECVELSLVVSSCEHVAMESSWVGC